MQKREDGREGEKVEEKNGIISYSLGVAYHVKKFLLG